MKHVLRITAYITITYICLIASVTRANGTCQNRDADIETLQDIDMKLRQELLSQSPEKQIQFWNIKIDDMLKLEWTNTEKEHILKVKEYYNNHPTIFNGDKVELKNLETFMNEWRKTAKESFGWDNNLTGAMFESALFLKDKTGALKSPAN